MSARQIDFDTELARGLASYGDMLGYWWQRQSGNGAHQRAYRNIARYIHASFQRPLNIVVDYACGAGDLLTRLAWRYPRTRFLGLDGSAFLLREAQRRIARHGRSFVDRIELVETPLPDFIAPRMPADLVVFAFPNIIPARENGDFRFAESHLTASELHILHYLSEQRVDEEIAPNPATHYATMLRDRAVSLHIRRLLKPGAPCIRVEYGTLPREQMSRSQIVNTMMEEGSLDHRIDGRRPRVWFRVVACRYFRSAVIEDVVHQDGSENAGGGYLITVLRAV